MNGLHKQQFDAIFNAYGFKQHEFSIEKFGNGHINDTFLLKPNCDEKNKKYILQRINTDVFRDPQILMENITKVLNFINSENNSNSSQELILIKTVNKTYYYKDTSNNYFRVYNYIENSISIDEKPNCYYAQKAGYGFGVFLRKLQNFDVNTLHEVIPDFHNTALRYKKLLNSAKNDTKNRLKEVTNEIAYFSLYEKEYAVIDNLLNDKKIPNRVTHNDTKLNNILFDKNTNEPICVIDLDTVMKGSSLYDFGDAIRFITNTASEDEKDLSKVEFSLELYTSFKQGYLEGCENVLTKLEKDLFAFSSFVMTIECAMRFLTDYLDGDIYFKTNYENHNLDRAKNQIKLSKSISKALLL